MKAHLLLALLIGGCAYAPATPFSELEDFKDIKFTRTKDNPAYKPQPIDLKDFHLTFEDEFNTMSVTDEDGPGPWYSPVHTDVGASHWLPPSAKDSPVFVKDGHLIIQLKKQKGWWVASNVQTANKKGDGFFQQYGYFEMRAILPGGMGAWSAFWLHSHPERTGWDKDRTEIDIVEAYGGDPRGHHSSIHIWPSGEFSAPGQLNKKWTAGTYNGFPDLLNVYHTYGAQLTPDYMIFYLDRREISRVPTPPQFKTPQYMLMDLTMLPKELNQAKGVMEMKVDYVRVWQRNDNYSTNSLNK